MKFSRTEMADRFNGADVVGRLNILKSLAGKNDEDGIGFIIEAMGDSSWQVRKEAVAALATMDDKCLLVHRLVERISDNSNVGRRNAAVELFAFWGKVCVPPLLADLMQVNEDTQKVIIDVLGDIREPMAIPFLLTHILGEKSLEETSAGFADNLRSAALEALGKLRPSDEAVDKILPFLLNRENYLLVFSAIKALERIGSSLAVPHLVALSGEKIFRRAALEALGTIADVGALECLLAGFHSDSDNIRCVVVKALVRLESKQSPGEQRKIQQAVRAVYNENDYLFLLSLLQHSDVTLRGVGIRVLGWVSELRSVPTLISLLNDYEEDVISALITIGSPVLSELAKIAERGLWESDKTRHAAAVVLGAIPDAHSFPLLVDLLSDDASSVREAAVSALGKIKAKEAIRPLLSMLKDPYPEVQESARLSLLAMQRDIPMDELVGLLSERSTRLRANAAILLGEMKYEAAVPAIAFLIKDSDDGVRRSGVYALGQFLHLEHVRKTLLQALGDEDYKVRVAVLHVLEKDRAALLLGDIAPMIYDDNIWVRAALARTLAWVSGEEALRLLLQLSEDPTGMVQIAALTSLGQRGEAVAANGLRARLSSPDRDVQKAAILALGVFGDPEALSVITPFLSDGHWELRAAAASAVGNLKGAAEKLKEMSDFDEDPLVRDAAALALSHHEAVSR